MFLIFYFYLHPIWVYFKWYLRGSTRYNIFLLITLLQAMRKRLKSSPGWSASHDFFKKPQQLNWARHDLKNPVKLKHDFWKITPAWLAREASPVAQPKRGWTSSVLCQHLSINFYFDMKLVEICNQLNPTSLDPLPHNAEGPFFIQATIAVLLGNLQ